MKKRFDADREGIRFYGKGFMGGFPWPWRVHKHWQWHAGRGRFKSSSGLILHAMNYGIITPFVQVLVMVPERETIDYLTLPWHLLRYAFAWCWTESWRLCLKVKYWHLRKTDYSNYRWLTQPGHGRHTDPNPILCPACLWGGARRWLVHTYTGCGEEDVEPCDECPRCGEEL